MISQEKLFEIIVAGRLESYKQRESYKEINAVYKWYFETQQEEFLYTDSYRGFNPFSGVEYLYLRGSIEPLWYCDYIGFVKKDSPISPKEVFGFLREGRKNQLETSNGGLLLNYSYEGGPLKYDTSFSGDIFNLIHFENIFYNDNFIAQMISAGRITGEKE
jgi:hypothetical protein